MLSIIRRFSARFKIGFNQIMFDWFGLNGVELIDAYLSQVQLDLAETDKLISKLDGYVRFHKANYDNSLERFRRENPDVGAEYPMFLHETNASDRDKSVGDHYKKMESALDDLKKIQEVREQFHQKLISLTAERDQFVELTK